MKKEHLKELIFSLLFISVTFINVIKLDNEYQSSSFDHNIPSTQIELVCDSYPSFCIDTFSQNQKSHDNNVTNDFLLLKKHTISFSIHNYPQQILTHQLSYSPNHFIISILQKANTWHQSSNDIPLDIV